MTNQPQSPSPFLWWQTGVIYQIYPRSFKDSNGDGIGDLAGVIQKMDYLSDTLGIDAIWLSPFYPSPNADFGYDISNYRDIDPVFGTLETFDELLQAAHLRGMKVIIDLVPNHTSNQHPWFLESRSSRDNPKRDWYIWRDPRPDGSPPNNWLATFGGQAWEWDELTGQYYLHSFLKEQPDLNWRNPEVKTAMFDMLRFWLERGVDGFRIDTAHLIVKDPELRDNPPNLTGRSSIHKSMGEFDTQIHKYDRGHLDIHGVYREFRRLLDEYSQERPRMSVGEIHIFDWPVWASYYGEQLDEIHMPFNFALLGVRWDAPAVQSVVSHVEAAVPTGGWPNYVLGNHDEARFASRIGKDEARVAAMLLLSLRGTPTLYYGDELGMTNVSIPPEKEQDPWGMRVPGLGRDPARTPMQWTPGPSGGFSQATPGDLWLPLAEDYAQENVATELEQPHSMLNLYRRLLSLRRLSPSLQLGDYTPVIVDAPHVMVYLRKAEGHPAYLVALNFSTQEQNVRFHDMGPGQVKVSSYLDREDQLPAVSDLFLRGNEGLWIQLEG